MIIGNGSDHMREAVSRRARLRFGLCLVATIVLGAVAFMSRGTPFDAVANHAGGGLYVLAWIFFVLMLTPGLNPLRVSAAVLMGTCGVEFLQLWQPWPLELIRSTLVGRLLLGTSFTWGDFPAYFAGALVGFKVASVVASGGRS